MTQEEILTAVKAGLGISGTFNDVVISQKVLATKAYMTYAGVNDENLNSDLGIACICIGVTDLWNLTGGDIKFSPAFGMLVEQLAVISLA